MRNKALFKTLNLSILVLTVYLASFSYVSADMKTRQKGASVVPVTTISFSEASFKDSLQNLKNMNANYVDLIIPIYQPNATSSVLYLGWDTPLMPQ